MNNYTEDRKIIERYLALRVSQRKKIAEYLDIVCSSNLPDRDAAMLELLAAKKRNLFDNLDREIQKVENP